MKKTPSKKIEKGRPKHTLTSNVDFIELRGKHGTLRREILLKDKDVKTFGQYLIFLRQGMVLTQQKFSEKFNVHQSYISLWERGKTTCSKKALERACKIFKLDFKKMKDRFLKEETTMNDLKNVCDRILTKVEKTLKIVMKEK